MSRALEVFIASEQVGTLFENQGVWSFQYREDWVKNGYALSPGLALSNDLIEDGGSVRPVQWFFDNLLPEDAARARLFASLPENKGDAWDLLEQFGGESAGALTLLPPGAVQAEAGLRPLLDEELDARILAMSSVSLGASAPKKMSLAGAQEKLPIVIGEDGALFDPVGAQISTHILKPNSLSAFYPDSAVNEWFCARVAQELKLPVPKVTLRYVPSCVYIIERFDRLIVNGRLERVHTLDAVQLLSLDAGIKYTRSGVAALRDVVEKCRAKAAARIALFRWTLFNALIGNGDAHLKNLSLYAGRNGYSLAPHYDLVGTAAWSRPDLVRAGEASWSNIALSFPVGNARTFGELTAKDFFVFAEALGVPDITVRRELRNMGNSVLPAAEKVLAEYEQRTDVPAAIRAGQLRMIRSIIFLPIKTMQGKLDVA